MNIAEPYCNWSSDEGASRAPVLIARNMFIGIALLSFVWIIITIIVSKTHPEINQWWVMGAFHVMIVSAILSNVFQSKASSSQIRCTQCGQNMRHVQHDFPGEVGGPYVIHGENGRVYVQMQGPGQTPTMVWFRLMQELRVCEECKRYVVLQKQKRIQVGTKRLDVDTYERQQKSNRQAIVHAKQYVKRKKT